MMSREMQYVTNLKQNVDLLSTRMRTRRSLLINNSLCHGICNYNCTLCGVGKSAYTGPKVYQPLAVTEKLVREISIAASRGIHIRGIHQSGMGEPTLHPEFAERLGLFEQMRRDWQAAVPVPDVVVVTNGSTLLDPDILSALTTHRVSLAVSFPTPVPEHYGALMMEDVTKGASLLETVIPGIRVIMEQRAAGRIRELLFYISPPKRDVIRPDFHRTLCFLTRQARDAGLDTLNLVLFVTSFNRTGLVRNRIKTIDFYPDFFKRYQGRSVNGVTVQMITSYKKFYPDVRDVLDLLMNFTFPCLQNGHLLIAADGRSLCPNDQEARNPFGDILNDSIESLLIKKEQYRPTRTCARCDSAPHQMSETWSARLYSLIARAKLRLARFNGFDPQP